MQSRGRRSTAEKEAAVVIDGLFGKRPEPPTELTERQADIWREVVASEDPAFFDTGALRGILADYCRHREAGEKISAAIDLFKAEWLRSEEGLSRYYALLKARDLETRAAAGLATKLRMTNQARYTPQAAATAARSVPKRNPWDL